MTISVKLPMMNADRATDRNMKNVAQMVSAMFWAAEHKNCGLVHGVRCSNAHCGS